MYYKIWEWIEDLLNEIKALNIENETLHIQLSEIRDQKALKNEKK